MTVELAPVSSQALKQLLKTGLYSNPAEAVAEGLRLLQQLLNGADQIRAGKTTPFDAATVARIKAQGRKLLAAEKRAQRSAGR